MQMMAEKSQLCWEAVCVSLPAFCSHFCIMLTEQASYVLLQMTRFLSSFEFDEFLVYVRAAYIAIQSLWFSRVCGVPPQCLWSLVSGSLCLTISPAAAAALKAAPVFEHPRHCRSAAGAYLHCTSKKKGFAWCVQVPT
jgi:hypothetical protein